MSTDQPFSEQEIRDVFERAAADQERATRRAVTDGLTVDELAEAGEASGIRREFVEAAARAVRLGVPESRRETRAGVPTGVSYTAFLAEPPSDDLWERLVADARRTFHARGTVDTTGHLREWRNGNLVLTLGPAADGSRLDVRSRRSDALPLVWVGAVVALVGLFVAVMGLMSGEAGAWMSGFVALLLGAAMAGSVGVRQRGWATTREEQMRGLVERATALGSAAPAVAASALAPALASAPVASPVLRLDLDALGDELGDARTGEARRARS